MKTIVLDIDFLIFEAVSVAEERFITAHHTPTGRKMEFANKTKLWGDWRKKIGGWLGEENEKLGNDYWKAEDFEVVECQRPRPFKIKGINPFSKEPEEAYDYFISPWDGAKKIIDDKIKSICDKLGTTNYIAFTGTGDVFRHDLSTILKYKDRDDLMKPLLLKKMKDYVVDRHSTTLVEKLEADDWVALKVLEGYNKWVKSGRKDEDIVFGVAEDKDSKQTSGWWYNPNKDTKPRLIEGFGELFINPKGDVDGYGRLWLYQQTLDSDKADNYCANSASDMRWGEKKAYELLKDCTTDKQAFEALVLGYKTLYPQPKTITGWRGDEIEIDWLYVLQENFNLAKMLRSADEEPTDVKSVLQKLKVNF